MLLINWCFIFALLPTEELLNINAENVDWNCEGKKSFSKLKPRELVILTANGARA